MTLILSRDTLPIMWHCRCIRLDEKQEPFLEWLVAVTNTSQLPYLFSVSYGKLLYIIHYTVYSRGRQHFVVGGPKNEKIVNLFCWGPYRICHQLIFLAISFKFFLMTFFFCSPGFKKGHILPAGHWLATPGIQYTIYNTIYIIQYAAYDIISFTLCSV